MGMRTKCDGFVMTCTGRKVYDASKPTGFRKEMQPRLCTKTAMHGSRFCYQHRNSALQNSASAVAAKLTFDKYGATARPMKSLVMPDCGVFCEEKP